MKIEFNAQIIKKEFMRDFDISECSNNYICHCCKVFLRYIIADMYMHNFYYIQY